MELNLTRNVKVNKKISCKYMGGKSKIWKNVSLLLNELWDLVTQDNENVKLPNAFFASVFTSKTGLQEPQVPGTEGKPRLSRCTLDGRRSDEEILKWT